MVLPHREASSHYVTSEMPGLIGLAVVILKKLNDVISSTFWFFPHSPKYLVRFPISPPKARAEQKNEKILLSSIVPSAAPPFHINLGSSYARESFSRKRKANSRKMWNAFVSYNAKLYNPLFKNSLWPRTILSPQRSYSRSLEVCQSLQNSAYFMCSTRAISRRTTLAIIFGSGFSVLASPSPSHAQAPVRTLFDEEREMSEKTRREAEDNRIGALRAGFEAVQKALGQLDDLQVLVQDGKWGEVRGFARLFNDAVEREGMEAVAKNLRKKEGRKEALAISRQVTGSLVELDRCAREENKEGALMYLQQARSNVLKFDSFKP